MSSIRCKVSPGIRHWMIALPLSSLTALVAAQEPNEQAAETASKRRVIEEVIVSATKRDASLRDIPASITAFGGDQLEQQGVQGIAELTKLTPGMNLQDDGINAKRITIRGISADLGANFTSGTFLGDVPFSDPYVPRVALDPNPFDLGSVEILKGPQGTLFGGSALNGAIRYIPQKPLYEQWEFKYYTQYEQVELGDSALSYGAAVNLPLFGDDLALRLMAFDREGPGYVDALQRNEKDVNSLDQDGVRGQLFWLPGERSELRLTWQEQQTEIHDTSATDNFEGRLENGQTPRASTQSNEYTFANLGFTYGLRFFDVVAEVAEIQKDYVNRSDLSRIVDGSIESLQTDIVNYSETRSAELRLVSTHEGPWQWIFGGFYFDYHMEDLFDLEVDNPLVPTDLLANLVGLPFTDSVLTADGELSAARFRALIDVEERALFGELSRTVWDRFDLTLGLRVFKTSSGGTVDISGATFAPQTITQGDGTTRTVEDDIREDGINPKFALHWHIDDDRSIFLSASKGFRFGGLNAAKSPDGNSPDSFKSDTLWNYELGLRSLWFDQALQFDLTLYYIDWDDAQVLQYDSVTLTGYLDNAGRVKGKGAELAIRYLPPIDGLSLSLSAVRSDTRLDSEFTTLQGAQRQPGDPWPLAPDFSSATTIAYQRNLGSWELGTSLSHYYTAEAFSNIELLESEIVNGFGTWDLQLSLGNSALRWLPRMTLNVSNLTDKRGRVAVSENYKDVVYTRPRTIALRFSGDF